MVIFAQNQRGWVVLDAEQMIDRWVFRRRKKIRVWKVLWSFGFSTAPGANLRARLLARKLKRMLHEVVIAGSEIDGQRQAGQLAQRIFEGGGEVRIFKLGCN